MFHLNFLVPYLTDLDLTQVHPSLLETLATLYESASTSTQFVDGRVKGTFASDHVFDLNQNTVSPLKIKSLTKKIKAVCETFFN